MFEGLFHSTSIPILEQLVRFSQTRHTILAGNIANLDTPGYQAKDLSVGDFQARMREAIEAGDAAGEETSPGEMTAGHGKPLAEVAKDSQVILRHDGGDVSLESQVTEMVKNQMEHNLAVSILQNQYHLLQSAISERL
jgi:flagellar basal-body rod protein FlgB